MMIAADARGYRPVNLACAALKMVLANAVMDVQTISLPMGLRLSNVVAIAIAVAAVVA